MPRPIKNGNYVVPKEVAALKPSTIKSTVKAVTPPGTKKPKVHYYVYEIYSVPDPRHPEDPNKTILKNDRCIGKIEGGEFCPNKVGKQRLLDIARKKDSSAQEKEAVVAGVPAVVIPETPALGEAASNINIDLVYVDLQIKDYGEYAIVLSSTESVLRRLNRHFSVNDSRLIYALCIIYFVEEYTPASYAKDEFDKSILSNKWPSLAISENTIGEFLKLLGRHPMTCEKYAQGIIDDSSGMTAIDGHVILSCSGQNELADYGNKYRSIQNKQLNILEAYDVINDGPLTSKAYEGGLLDKTSVQDLFMIYVFPENTVFLVDMGFYSEENLGLYREGGRHFIIPVPDSAVISKAMRTSTDFTEYFFYKKKDENGNTHNDMIQYRESTVRALEDEYQKILDEKVRKKNEEALARCRKDEKPKKYPFQKVRRSAYEDDRVIMYRDKDMHDKMVSEFLSQIGTDDQHTAERLEELAPEFGIIILRTNKDCNSKPEEIYINYKSRWKIETHYNFIDNIIKFYGLKTDDYYTMQGLSFLVLVVGQIKSAFVKKMRSASSNYVRHLSIKESLAKAGRYKMSQHMDGVWHVTLSTKKNAELMKEMGVNIAEDVRKLNAGIY